MPSPANIVLSVKKNGGAPASGFSTTAAFSDSIVLSVGATGSGAKRVKYRIYEFPDGFALPAGWTAESARVYSVTVASGGDAPAFALPGSGADLRGKYFFDATANDGLRNGKPAGDLVSKAGLRIPFLTAGLEDAGFLETNEFDDVRQIMGAIKKALRLLDQAVFSGGGVTDHGALSGLTDITDHAWAELAQRPANPLSGASNDAALADLRRHITTSHGSACTLRIRLQSAIAWLADGLLIGNNIGAGALTLTPEAGVTLNAVGGSLVVPQWAWWFAKRRSSNTWDVVVIGGVGAGGTGDFKADGTVPATGDFDLDGHKLTDLAAATNPNDATRLAQVESLIAAAISGIGTGSSASGFTQTFDSSTTDADPGDEEFRLNHATPSSATALYLDDLASDATNVRDLIASWGSLPGTIKGRITLRDVSAPANWITYSVTGYTSATGYGKLTGLTVVDSSATVTFSGEVAIEFDAGPTGILLTDGSNSPTAAIDWNNQRLDDVRAISYEGEADAGDSGTADNIDWTTSALYKSRLTGNCTYTFTGAPQPFTYVQLRCTQDGTGGRTVTLPAACVSLDGIVWQPNPAPDAPSFLTLYCDGTSYYYYGRSPDARVITESTTARTFGLADAGAYIRTTNGSATTLTVPPNGTIAFQIGAEITGIQAGVGQITFAPGSGVTINKPATRNLATGEQYSTWALKKVATNEWDLFGDLEVA